MHRSAPLIALVAVLVAGCLAASASGALIIGVADQNTATYSLPTYQALHSKRTRLITSYDAIFKDADRLDGWLQAVRSHNLEPVVAFNPSAGSLCPNSPCRAPSVAQYTKAFKAFHAKYPWVKIIQPWNEVNSPTQPTARNPKIAALYYNVVKKLCHGCTVPAADVQDLTNLKSWLKVFNRYVKGHPRLWGLHNYSSVNRFKSDSTATALRLLPGKVWLTEVGGLYRFQLQNGTITFPNDESRQARAVDFMVKLALRYKSKIQRLYYYQFSPDAAVGRFDAGLVGTDGQPRLAYTRLLRYSRYIR